MEKVLYFTRQTDKHRELSICPKINILHYLQYTSINILIAIYSCCCYIHTCTLCIEHVHADPNECFSAERQRKKLNKMKIQFFTWRILPFARLHSALRFGLEACDKRPSKLKWARKTYRPSRRYANKSLQTIIIIIIGDISNVMEHNIETNSIKANVETRRCTSNIDKYAVRSRGAIDQPLISFCFFFAVREYSQLSLSLSLPVWSSRKDWKGE